MAPLWTVGDEAGDLAGVEACVLCAFGEDAILVGAAASLVGAEATGDLALDVAGAGAGAAMEDEMKHTKAKTRQRSAMNRAILFLS